MLRLVPTPSPHPLPVRDVRTGRSAHLAGVLEEQEQEQEQEQQQQQQQEQQLVHVTDLSSFDEGACRVLDAVARRQFADMTCRPGTVDVLQAPAGGGKTQANIDLATSLLRKGQAQQVLIVAFNKAAVRDGEQRTRYEPRIVWRTLDSLVWQLYKEQLGDLPDMDPEDVLSICKTANRLLETPLYEEEAEQFQKALYDACNTGDPSRLVGDALELYAQGMRGRWWCFSLLRVRALEHPEWERLFRAYGTIVVDESQDLNIVMVRLLRRLHATKHMVYTGDVKQKLYSFMGCVNVVDHLAPGSYRLWRFYLTHRHGPAVCEYVNDRCLPLYSTFASASAPETRIAYVADDDVLDGSHTWILSSWMNILELADRLINAGRAVRIDGDKRDELLAASVSRGWTKLDKSLFKRLHRDAVRDVVSRVRQDEVVAADEIMLTTTHGWKGLQTDTVRVSRCVMEAKLREDDFVDDRQHKIYVSVTRVRRLLYLPGGRSRAGRRGAGGGAGVIVIAGEGGAAEGTVRVVTP